MKAKDGGDRLVLEFGQPTYPQDARAVWGARLIWPNDLVWDRQSLDHRDPDAPRALFAWLNEDGALGKALTVLGEPDRLGWASCDEHELVVYEDDKGRIVGSPRGSYGYVYIAAWLKERSET